MPIIQKYYFVLIKLYIEIFYYANFMISLMIFSGTKKPMRYLNEFYIKNEKPINFIYIFSHIRYKLKPRIRRFELHIVVFLYVQ